MSEIVRRPVELAPLSPELSPEVMAWAAELRAQFVALGMSISLFCRLHPIDKGTVSRYLNGKRVPADRWFLDQIMALRVSAGTPVTDEVRAHLVNLQMAALKVAHPHEYRVRKVSDQLEIAVTSWKEAERYAQTLEQELTERTRVLQDLLSEAERLRAAWDEDRVRHEQEIIYLTQQLELARDRVRQAEQRVQVLEELLDQLETQQPAQEQFGADINPEDTRAVAGLLDSLRRAGAEGQIAMLVERIPDLPLDLRDPYDVAGLLDALRRVGAKEQITVLAERVPDLSLRSPYTMAKLLDVLRRAEAKEQIAVLVERIPDLYPNLKDHSGAVELLDALRRVGAQEQIAILTKQLPEFPLDHWYGIVRMLNALRRVGAKEQIATVVKRIPDLPLRDVSEAVEVLEALQKVGAKEQIDMVIKKVPDLPVSFLHVMVKLVYILRQIGAKAQIMAMAESIAADVDVISPRSVAELLRDLNWAGADEQVAALAERASRAVPVRHEQGVSDLVQIMQILGAGAPAKVLAERLALAKGPGSGRAALDA
ncbi:hypothetical protein [Microbispora sp. H11081]|uniref:hypothetical protein n=1 Tax=Microbispora sp. H11081 TaxID=2729107 RepID=UPI001472E05F|nr:hypothetical protein [Microbispora sp. H11081]